MIKAVLFDMDGVLIDSYRAWFEVVNAAARHYGKDEITPGKFETAWGQSTAADVEKFFNGCTIMEIERYYRDNFDEYAKHITVMPETKPVLAGLRGRGIGTAVITNTWSPLAKDVLEKCGIEHDVLVGDGDVENSKPAPDMIFKACELLEVETREAVFVGDSAYDHAAAEAAGVRFIAVGGFESEVRIDSLDEIFEHI